MVLSTVPRLLALKSNSNNKYVRHSDGSTSSLIQVNGDDVSSQQCQFEAKRSENENRFYHIRSSYNSKYWVIEAAGSEVIVAGAKEPNEKLSEWSCTLFEPLYPPGDASTIQLRCVHSGKFIAVFTDGVSLRAGGDAAADVATKFAVIDWESLVILPKRVAFKGDNGKYLGIHKDEGFLNFLSNLLKFDYTDIADSRVAHEIVSNPNGSRSVHIKSLYAKRFWSRKVVVIRDQWIMADKDTTRYIETWFEPVKVDSKRIALRSLSTNLFCKRLTDWGRTNFLSGCIKGITEETKMTVEELVSFRKIYNVKFRDARIYNHEDIADVKVSEPNYTSVEQTTKVTLKWENISNHTWNHGYSVKTGVATTITASIPYIKGGEFGISAETETVKSVDWGESVGETQSKEITHTLKVPAMRYVKTTLKVKRSTMEVPFSYSAHDLLTDGTTDTYDKDDGLFTGVYTYEVNCVDEECELPAK